MPLTESQRLHIQQRIMEAETALHALLMGKQAVSVSYDGKAVTYNQTNIGTLRAYIVELKGQLGVRRPPPLRPFF